MDPITLTLMAASAGGGLMNVLGQKKAKSIDPEWLKKHFGAEQVNQEMVQLFNHILSSPYGQQMMTNAAQQGQQFQTDEARQAARAGFGPTGGADSGSSIFSGAAAGGATNSFQRGIKSDIMQAALPMAQQMVQNRMGVASQSEQNRLDFENARPSRMSQIGQMISSGANAAMSATPSSSGGGNGMRTLTDFAGGGQYQSTPLPSPYLPGMQPQNPQNMLMARRRPSFVSRFGNALSSVFQPRMAVSGAQ